MSHPTQRLISLDLSPYYLSGIKVRAKKAFTWGGMDWNLQLSHLCMLIPHSPPRPPKLLAIDTPVEGGIRCPPTSYLH